MATTVTAADVELTIDPEFSELLPAHSENESKSLREKVERQGKFDGTILYWPNGGKNIVLDGHQRNMLWASLPENTPIPPPVVEAVNVPDRESAKQWMLLHQAGRRNMDPAALSVIRGRLFKLAEKPQQPNIQQEKGVSGHSVQKPPSNGRPQSDRRNAVRTVAAKTGVSEKTIERDAEFVDALDAIGKVNSKAKHDIESGSLKVPRKTVVAISGLPDEKIGKALGNVRNGRAWNDGLDAKPTTTNRTKKPDSPLKPIATASGALSRALAKSGEKHGQGTHYKAIFAALTTINEAVSKWEASL